MIVMSLFDRSVCHYGEYFRLTTGARTGQSRFYGAYIVSPFHQNTSGIEGGLVSSANSAGRLYRIDQLVLRKG